MEIRYWLYGSRCTIANAGQGAVITDIVKRSQVRNNEAGITGALMFTGTQFAQYLEGPSLALHELRTSIMRDPRHRDIYTFDQGAATVRHFPDWSLAYSGRAPYLDQLVSWSRDRQRSNAKLLLVNVMCRLLLKAQSTL